MAVHIFFDNSNIFGGAQKTRLQFEPNVPWPAIRLYYRNLFSLLEDGRPITTRILAGSVPPPCEALWEYARSHGYNTDLLRRVQNDDGSFVEQGVDEVMHLKIANVLLDYPETDTLLIATGDGSISEFGTGFVSQIERALQRGWNVEIWSWKSHCSGKYRAISRDSGGQLKLHYLDDSYSEVTFVRGGSFFTTANDGTKIPCDVTERVVQPLSVSRHRLLVSV